jgi:hypothetical protein
MKESKDNENIAPTHDLNYASLVDDGENKSKNEKIISIFSQLYEIYEVTNDRFRSQVILNFIQNCINSELIIPYRLIKRPVIY